MGTTKAIAEWILGTGHKDFDPALVKYTKDLCLNALGSSLAGAMMPAGRSTVSYVRERGGPEEAGVIGGGFRTALEYAALANGATSHVTELEDDAHPEDCYTCGVLPAVFTLGDMLHISGQQAIEGFILGYEVAVKLSGRCPEMLNRGLLTDSYFGAVGVAGMAAKMLGLDVEGITNALSIAASQACGLLQQHGAGAHLLESGFSCRNGVSAALLAKHGLTGKLDILERPKGLCDAVAGVSDLGDLDLNGFRLKKGLVMKKYPACSLQHTMIRGFLELKKEHGISADDIESIQVDVHAGFMSFNDYHHPENYMEAPFALPHAIAVCFMEDRVFLDGYTEEKVHDPKIHAFREKVNMVLHPEWDRAGVAGKEYPICVRLKDGRELNKVCPGGAEVITLSDEDIMERYMGCALRALSRQKAGHAAEMILGLEKIKDISALMDILTFTDKS